MTVKSKQNELLTAEAILWLVKHGIRPDNSLITKYTQDIANNNPSFLTTPPPMENGTVAESRQWEAALKSLNIDIESIRQQLARLKCENLENDWQYINRRLTYLERLNSIKTGSGSNTNSFVEKFTHLSFLFDIEADGLPDQNCEIDFLRLCVTLPQYSGWCSKQDISNSDIVWHVEPVKCPAEQSGNIKDLAGNYNVPWMLSVGETTSATLTITVKPQQSVIGNSLFIDIISRYDNIAVLVNGSKAVAVNKGKTWWIFPAQPVKSVEIAITKDNYDVDTGKKHYFCIRNLTLQYNRYIDSGVFISHAVKIDGSEIRIKPEVSMPENTSVIYYAGFQEGRRIYWQITRENEWIKIPRLGDKVVDYITYNPADPPIQVETGIYMLHRFGEHPIASSIELYPGLNMWAVESVATNDSEPTLENWFKLRQNATIYRYMPLTSGLTIHNKQMYRLYTYALVDMPAGTTIENWRPASANVSYNIYVNNVEQIKENNKYNLRLHNGWNLIEIIAIPDREVFFDPMLYLEDSASIVCLSKKPARIVSLEDIRHAGHSMALDIASYHNGALLVNYPAKLTGSMRYLCKYHTGGKDNAIVRFMVDMRTNTPDFSPILTGYTIQWR